MKWKTILVMLLVAAMAGCTVIPTDLQTLAKAEKKIAEAETMERIRQYELVKQEQQLIFDIMRLRHDTAVIQKAMQPKQVPPQKVVVPPPEAKE